MEVGSHTTHDDSKAEDWPTPAESSASFADIVKSQSTAEPAEINASVPKLCKSLPQITESPKTKGPGNIQPEMKKITTRKEKLTGDDLAFLQEMNETDCVALKQGYYKTSNSSKRGKYRGRRRQANNTSTPSKNFSSTPARPSLSPQQIAMLKHMGFHPDSGFAKGIAATLDKRK